MTALALLAPLIGLALVLMLQVVESRVLSGPMPPSRTEAPTPAPIPTPFR